MSQTLLQSVLFLIIYLNSFCFSLQEGIPYWRKFGYGELEEALRIKKNENVAKNVLLFIGDGMGLPAITAARIYSKTEKGYLAWEKFEHTGLLKTYSGNKFIPDSASSATAIFSGVKINQDTVGVDATVERENCSASLNPATHTSSILQWAMESGKATGFVTTTTVTHATPSALYAHSPFRKWECEAKMPAGSEKCKDIARQLIEDYPGRNIKVIMGGGRQMLQSNSSGTKDDPLDSWNCISKDGRNLIQDWQKDKMKRHLSFAVVSNNRELQDLEDTTEFVLGIFSNGHLPKHYKRNPAPEGSPSLMNMTEKAIKLLKKNKEGFLLVVESGQIDLANHRGHARQALDETKALSDAVDVAISLVDIENTLVVVTSDHSHSLSFLGSLDRNQNIFGVVQKPNGGQNRTPHTALVYAIGGPNNFQFDVLNGSIQRRDPLQDDTSSYEYSQQTGIVQDEALHGGEDVVIYATGPMSHLVHSVREQTFVAYLISYAAQIGPAKNFRNNASCKFSYESNLYSLLLLSVLYTTIVL